MPKIVVALRTAAVIGCSAAAVALAGCGGPGRSAAEAQPTPAAPGQSAGPASAAPSGAAEATPAQPSGAKSDPAKPNPAGPAPSTAPARSIADPCPVSAPVLYSALKADATFGATTKQATGLKTPACRRGYAVAQVRHAGDFLAVVFSYDAVAGRWRPINQGSGGFCTGFVPADVAKTLNGC